jgi:hypothetical protein
MWVGCSSVGCGTAALKNSGYWWSKTYCKHLAHPLSFSNMVNLALMNAWSFMLLLVNMFTSVMWVFFICMCVLHVCIYIYIYIYIYMHTFFLMGTLSRLSLTFGKPRRLYLLSALEVLLLLLLLFFGYCLNSHL